MSNPFSIADTEHPSPGSTTKLQFMRKLLSFFSSLFFFFLFFSFVDRRITAMPKFHYMPRTIVPRRSCFVSHCCLTCFEFFFFFPLPDFPNHDIGHPETRYSFPDTISFLNSENFQLECWQTFISILTRKNEIFISFLSLFFFFFIVSALGKNFIDILSQIFLTDNDVIGIKILKFLFRGRNYIQVYICI